MNLKKHILLSLLSGVLGSILLVFLFPGGEWWITLLSAGGLIASAVFVLLRTVDWLDGGRHGLALTLTAFVLRLGIGVFLLAVLPIWGYDTDQQNAGYLFKDAFVRDTASWELAVSGEPLGSVFGSDFFEDQYGGLSLLSSFVYRFLSPDLHRPYLVLILTSFAFALGVPFFWVAVQKRWDRKLAIMASWLLVLYPEGIFFTVSQMREPFMIGAGMVLLWGVISWFEAGRRKAVLAVCIPTTLIMFVISLRAGLGILVFVGLWWWIEHIRRIPQATQRRRQWLAMAATLVLGAAALFIVAGEWLRYTIWWDMREMSLTSGWLEILNEGLPQPLQYAVTTVFGVLQVVLPSAVIETSIPLWKVITILRSLGWYLMLPLLIAGFMLVWKEKDRKERWVWLFFLVMGWGWIFFSSLRAGGDLWDNPRYRMIYLPWLVLMAAYFWQKRGHWLWHIVAVEGVALLGFSYWYLSRYFFPRWHKPPIRSLVFSIIAVAVIVAAHGVFQEWRNSRRRQPPSSPAP